MRRMLRPIRLGTVGTCLLLVVGVMAALSAAGAGTAARPWMDRSLTPQARAERLLAAMTLEEKVGQMTQAERGPVSDDPSLVATWRLRSVLSGGGSTPADNTPEGWADMVDAFQAQAVRQTRAGDPAHLRRRLRPRPRQPGRGDRVPPQHRARRHPRPPAGRAGRARDRRRDPGHRPPVGVRSLRVRGQGPALGPDLRELRRGPGAGHQDGDGHRRIPGPAGPGA